MNRAPRIVSPLSELGEALLRVEKPARYLGGELGAPRRGPPDPGELVVALCFPDLYEIGMSNNAIRILYAALNALPGVRCERVFAPAPDFEALLAERGIPLYTLESGIALGDCDLLAFSLGYELAATSILSVLESGGVPLMAAERGEGAPIVIAGGPAISNPHPFGLFLDAAYIGEAEASFFALCEKLASLKAEGRDRSELLARLAEDAAVWIPARGDASRAEAPRRARRAIYEGFPEARYDLARPLPTVKTVQDHGTVEIMRGCPNGCRFCHAGYYYRPQRERPPELLVEEALSLVDKGGYDEITLASLSSGDYACIGELLEALKSRLSPRGVSLQLPSLKISSFTLPLLESLSEVRKGGLTFAVETPVDAWQRLINKDVTYEKTLAILKEAKAKGYRLAKFYFMIGLPVPERGKGEVAAIVELMTRLSREAPMSFNVNVGTFVPKPHTPFQWCSQLGEIEALEAVQELRSRLRPLRNVKLSWHSPFVSTLEGVIARGDERVGELILAAYKAGARLDAWEERFDRDLWRAILEAADWKPLEGAAREREPADSLPWDDISIGVSKAYLAREYERALRLEPTSACIEECATPCGSCSDSSRIVRNSIHPRATSALTRSDTETAAIAEGADRYKLYLRFAKRGVAAYYQHLSIIDCFFRAFRILGLPLSLSEGFNPMPRFETVQPLSLGVESLAEVASLQFSRVPASFSGEEGLLRLSCLLRDSLPEGLDPACIAFAPMLAGEKQHSLGSLAWGSRFSLRDRLGLLDRDRVASALIERGAELGVDGMRILESSASSDGKLLVVEIPEPNRKESNLLRMLEAIASVDLAPARFAITREACLFRSPAGAPAPIEDLVLGLRS